MLKYCQQLYPSFFKHMEKGTLGCCMICLQRKQNERSEIFKTPPWFSTWHEEQIQEGKRKPLHWCVWGAPGAHHSDRPREKTSFISMIWKSHQFISPWVKKFWLQFFRAKSSLCTFWSTEGNQYQHFNHTLPLSPSPEPQWQPHISLPPGWLPVREGIAGVKEWRPWPLRKAHGACSSLLPSSPQSTALSPVMAKWAVSISTPHWAPAPKLSPLAPCPGVHKHPQTHPRAMKHLPGFPHHSQWCKGVNPFPWRKRSLGRSCPCLPG